MLHIFVETQEKQKLMICWKPVSQPHCLAMLHQLRHSEEINLDILTLNLSIVNILCFSYPLKQSFQHCYQYIKQFLFRPHYLQQKIH